jgi:hypothetical protein
MTVHRYIRTYVQIHSLSFSGMLENLRKATVSFVMSVYLFVRMEQLGLTGWVFMKFWIWNFR